MKKLWLTAASVGLLITSTYTYAFNKLPGYFVVEGGAYASNPGTSQNVGIDGLLGDRFHSQNQNNWGGLVGLGYMIHGFQNARLSMDFGINAFNLTGTSASGTIIQEFAFTNLAYKYNVSHTPVYAMAKALFNLPYERLGLTIDAGIGPNFMRTSEYRDSALNSVAHPDHLFKGHSNTTFSATAGLGLRFKLTEQLPLEVGYRFYYLGQGYLTPRSNQVLNNLKTGTNYANAIVFTIAIE